MDFANNMKLILCLILLTGSHFFMSTLQAHERATYLGNSAVLIESNNKKILFDPFFHNDFNIYRLVPQDLYDSVMQAKPPYDDIDAIFISHAHEDHFSAKDVIAYLNTHQNTQVFLPEQARSQILAQTPAKNIGSRLHGYKLNFNDEPISETKDGLLVEAVRIPHAGWPGRKDVENFVWRVTLGDGKTVMHMGDADPNDDHYFPFTNHWHKRATDLNMPPYWFFMSAEGRDILSDILNVQRNIGVHVPVAIPGYLQKTGGDFFSKPGKYQELP